MIANAGTLESELPLPLHVGFNRGEKLWGKSGSRHLMTLVTAQFCPKRCPRTKTAPCLVVTHIWPSRTLRRGSRLAPLRPVTKMEAHGT